MRRISTILLTASLVTCIAGASPAAAGEKYRVDSLYARWRTVTKVDGVQTREYWYVEAYSSTSRFRAYLDHLIYECTRQNGRLRCDRTLWESGRVGNAAASGFVFDRKLGSAGLDATFRLESKGTFVGTARVVMSLVGRGDIARTKYSYSYRRGCLLFKFNGHARYRRASATARLMRDGSTMDLGSASSASLGTSRYVDVEKTC